MKETMRISCVWFCCLGAMVACSVTASAGEPPATDTTAQQASPAQALGGVLVRYGGPRWSLVYGSYEGVEKFAVNELQRMVQRHIPYILETLPAGQMPEASRNLILVGTPKANSKIAELGQKGLVKLPTRAQGYTIACLASPWQTQTRLIVVAGADSSGVLYGVMELNKRLAARAAQVKDRREALDALPDFSLSEAPVIENRGIWTWGNAIYDYRRFIDNMARLKMNRLTVWNDSPPINCREFIEYAHSRGIQVMLGFAWGWGLTKLDPSNPEHLRLVKEGVLKTYEGVYRNLGMDGIYFQTFTEHDNTKVGGRSTASLACQLVNDIAGALLAKHPDLRIEWGLHATSIKENYLDLKDLNPRLTIVWEDAGGMPYSYDPEAPAADGKAAGDSGPPDPTIQYSKQLATFRPGSEFAMCAKGWIQVRWQTETETNGAFIIGERAHDYIRDRLKERQDRWDYANTKWIANYPVALRFYREIRAATAAPMTVVGLIEDGMFEEHIQLGAALLGEMLWDPKRDGKDVLEAARNPYYEMVE